MTDNLLAIIEDHVRDGNEAAIIEWAIGLTTDQKPPILLAVTARRKMLQRLEAVLSASAQADGLRSYTAPDGKGFSFGTGRRREVSEPRLLRNALIDAITDAIGPEIYARQGQELGDHPHLKAMRAAFREKVEVLLTPLDAFLALNEKYAKAAEPYITWEDASKTPRLKERYEK